MPTPDDFIAQELRNELEARLNSWKNERAALAKAAARIAELDALIATAEVDATTVKIAPRPKKVSEPTATTVGTK